MNRSDTPRDSASRTKHLRNKAMEQSDQELKRLLLQQAEQIEAERAACDGRKTKPAHLGTSRDQP